MLQSTFNILLIFITSLLATNFSLGQGSGNAVKLDGHDDYVLSSTDNRGIVDEVTVFAWVKTTSTKYHWIAGKHDQAGDRGYHLYIKDGKAAFGGRDGSTIYRTSGLSTSNVNDGNWHNIVGVCNEGTWSIYIDGILQSELITGYTNTNLANSAPLAIGRDYQANSEYFDGTIDEVRIWKKAIEGYGLGNPCIKAIPYASELVAHFDFDEGSGNTVKDISSSKLDATLINMNPVTARVISGAPLGDSGWYKFGSDSVTGFQYNGSLADGTVVLVEPIGAEVKGIYVYYVEGSPESTNGISSPEPAKAYFGVFTPLSPNVKHKVSYIINQEECSSRLLERHDNSVQQWHELQTTVKTDTATGVMTSSRGEYIVDQIPFSLGQDLTICQGERVSLQGPDQMASYTWSTGEKSQSIEVSRGGTYWLDVMNDRGCTTRASINIISKQEPILNTPLEAVACPGEKVTLDATLDGATYLWSNGKTTPKIEVVSPASVSVGITLGGCTYTKIFNVTDEECMTIPNVITPNGDNKNDFFVIKGASPADIEIEIFNGWGVSVYRKEGYEGNWGTQNLTAGTYYYVVKSSRSNRTLKGWVEVIL